MLGYVCTAWLRLQGLLATFCVIVWGFFFGPDPLFPCLGGRHEGFALCRRSIRTICVRAIRIHACRFTASRRVQVAYLMPSCHFRSGAFWLLISVLYLLNQT